jgi:hypothetical protein
MSEEPKRVLKTQAAPSGGPPKPPTNTARGLEDGSPDPSPSRLDVVQAKLNLAERLIEATSEQLQHPALPHPQRAELKKGLRELQAKRRKFQDQKK